jgi:RRXRR protein
MVPVLDSKNKPLFPCKERRARCLMQRGKAVPYWQKGVFCIKLTRKESENREEYSEIIIGLDTGSKREGYTIASVKGVILNITTDTKGYYVKEKIETRRMLRNNRRQRNTPYRKNRLNRATHHKERLPVSTYVRWNTKLLMVKYLLSIIPITSINVEDIKAPTRKEKGKRKWNGSFSPLEHGKNWFYRELKDLGLTVIKTGGYETKQYRDQRSFTKIKNKLAYVWEAHNVDSHVLAEIGLKTEIKPYLGLWQIEFLKFKRRALHKQNPVKGGYRWREGGTVSMGLRRGSVLLYQPKQKKKDKKRKPKKLCYLGGSSNGKISIHSILTGGRKNRRINKSSVKVLYTQNRRVQFLPRTKSWAPLHKFL